MKPTSVPVDPDGETTPSGRADPRDEYLRRWQRSGDPEALDHLLRIEILALKSWLRRSRRPGSSPSASVSDVVQQAIAQFLRAAGRSETAERPRFDNPRALRGFLWTTALRLLKDHARKRKVQVVQCDRISSSSSRLVEPAASGGQSRVDRDDSNARLVVLVNLLGPTDREILTLHYFDDQSIDALAVHLDLTPKAVHQRLVRARKNLRDRLAAWTDVVE